MAVLFAVLSYLIYIAALMCSHLSAFRVATNLRLAVSEHLAVLPLGFAETFGSGKLRKIIHESNGAAETLSLIHISAGWKSALPKNRMNARSRRWFMPTAPTSFSRRGC